MAAGLENAGIKVKGVGYEANTTDLTARSPPPAPRTLTIVSRTSTPRAA